MASAEERLKILKMVDEGKISADEGARLLSAIERGRREDGSAQGESARWLRVRVTDRTTGRSVVNVSLPLSLVDAGIKLGARFVPDMDGLDYAEFSQAIRAGRKGKIIDVEDEEENQHVEVYLE